MDDFTVLATVADLLRGKDRRIWIEILEHALRGEDPYAIRVPQVEILDVARSEGVKPADILGHLLSRGCKIDEPIMTAFDLERKAGHISHRLESEEVVMIRFQPSSFGLQFDSYERTAFGGKACIDYQKVIDAALKYGFRKPTLLDALYFRNRYWEAHRYTEGTQFYIGCEPLQHDERAMPIIPALKYERYTGWYVKARPVGLLDMSFGAGQGESFDATFVFALPQK